ncbi:ethylmalonyl-CoA decarboxylase-like [Lycorma delicatula]|uniref:ethylmalonyl-CoA decarboxylase-like n=1 Tax=Lycorma delicatula TaxID=130591 RepID=UPI003F518DDC
MSNIVKTTFELYKKQRSYDENGVDYYSGAEQPVEEIREFLGKFEGGKIDLTLNNENGIAKLVLNNPSHRNAITGRMMVELEEAVDELQKWKYGKGIIVYGAEGNFCSGGDLKFVKKICNPDDGFKMATFMQGVLNKLQGLPMISVAFIDGIGALGGGSEIAISCDYRLLSQNENTGIAFVHSKMGIVPAWGGAGKLVKVVGKQNAMDILLSARIIQQEEGIKLGLIDKVVASLDDAEKWLTEKTKADKSVVRSLKYIILNSLHNYDDPGNVERRLFSPLWGSVANKDALERHVKHKVILG